MNNKKKAVAIKYDSDTAATPKVKAKGIGDIAQKILELAEENEIPIYEDKDLTELLMVLELEQDIPADLYKAVAEVLAFVYKLNKKGSL